MPVTTNAHSLHSISTTASSKSGSTPKSSNDKVTTLAYPAPIARSGNFNHRRQLAAAPATIGRESGPVLVNSTHFDVTLSASSPDSKPSMNGKHPLPLASENPIKSAKPATGEKMFDFKYKNVYTTPPTRVGGRMTRGRATIGSGSGAGSGMGACSIM